ncbi:Derlin-1 [Cricetulus griseus]|uniref:Derlin-1 n=1 Tax=Cricetulus griseus TaxID=10029 RepID=G3INZ6_CRIGR|nr:Derlin-1 [Cricetulus griseus]
MSDIGDWFRSIPAITRYWFAATVAVPLIGKLGIISPAYFFLWPEAFLYRFQVGAGVAPWVETTAPRCPRGGGAAAAGCGARWGWWDL